MFQEKEELPKKPLVMNPLVIALGEKNTQSEDELSFKPEKCLKVFLP